MLKSVAFCPCRDLPEGFNPDDTTVMAFNRLAVEEGDDFCEQVLFLESKPLPYFEEEDENIYFQWYDCEGGAVDREEDNFGSPLKYVPAKEFKKINGSKFVAWNKAVLSFLNGLPPDMPVVLYWF